LREYEEAKRLWQEGLAIYREIGDPWGAADVLGNSGELANVLGEYAEAIQLAQESLALHKRHDNQHGMAWCFRVLGNAVCGLGDIPGARRYFHQALEMDISVQRIPFVLLALVGIAALLAAEGERERALKLLALVIHHPVSLQWAKDRAAPLVAQLEAELPPDVVAAAQERGRARDLDATVKELLAELENNSPPCSSNCTS
jgi:tetratricopeptide (TPR) repeat protein